MAQETRLAPIEFSNTPTQVLMNIGEAKRQEAARQQQMAFEQQKYLRQLQDEEMKRRFENMKNFNSIIQDKQWSKETRDMYLGGLIQKYSAPGMSSTQYLSEIGKDVSNLANYQRYRDSIYEKADKFISGLPQNAKEGFDANTFKNDFLKNALFNPDGSQKSLSELQAEGDVNWLEKTFTDNKDKYYNLSSAYDRIKKLVKEAPESTVGSTDKDIKGRLLTTSSRTIKFRPSFERLNKQTGEVEFRQDENGYLEDDVYKTLISFDDIDALATRSAKKFITDYNNSTKDQKKSLLGGRALPSGTYVDKDNDGLPDMLESDDLDLIKKGFLTNFVKKEMPQYNLPKESIKSIGTKTGSDKKPNDTNDFIDEVITTYNNGSPQDLADVLYRMKAGNGKIELTNAFVSKTDKGFRLEYFTGEKDEDGNKIKESKLFKPEDKNFRIELANFYQKATGSDNRAEKETLVPGKDKTPTSVQPTKKKKYNPQTGKYE